MTRSHSGIDLAEVEDWHFWFVGRDELVLTLLDRFDAGPRMLDVGCGTGRFAAAASRRGDGAVIAVDRYAPTRAAPAAAAAGDAERLPLREGAVDVVLARDVLEHVDDDAALAECRRVLRPGGLLVALVPAWPSLWSTRDEQAGHLRRYTRRALRRHVEAAGFSVEEIRGYQCVLLPVIAASRLLERCAGSATLPRENQPPLAVNALFARINRLEASAARAAWLRPPTGSTLAIVATRP